MNIRNKLNINISKKTQMKLILLCIFLMILFLNLLTPLIADDYSYAFGLDNKRVSNLVDVILNQADHYMTWGGRSVAHTIGQIFLIFPKVVFSFFNSIIYVLFIYLIYKHAKGDKDDKPLLLLLIHFGLYFLLPVFGQNCLWLIGSCNYLWTTTIILLFLYVYRDSSKKKDSIIKIISVFFLGFLSGWTNENTAFGLIVITLLFLLEYRAEKKVMKWHISGLLGCVVGFCVMILAPGNYVRNALFKDDTFIVIKLITRTINCTLGMLKYIMPLIIIAIILVSIYFYKKKKVDKCVYYFFAGAFFTVYSMALSPSFPERSYFGVVVFMIIGIIMLMFDIEKINKIFNIILVDAVLIISLFYINDYIILASDINNLRNVWKYRIDYIEDEKSKGNKDIELTIYSPFNMKNPNYGLVDILQNADEWPNNSIADYYGIDTISGRQ